MTRASGTKKMNTVENGPPKEEDLQRCCNFLSVNEWNRFPKYKHGGRYGQKWGESRFTILNKKGDDENKGGCKGECKGVVKKPILYLDLDGTLVQSMEVEILPHHWCVEVMKKLNIHFLSIPCDLGVVQHYILQIRPFVYDFLKQVYDWYEVIIFSAATKYYVFKIIDIIDPGGHIKTFFHRDHCTAVNLKNVFPIQGDEKKESLIWVKDLSNYTEELHRVVIIDNNATAFAFQLENGIFIKTWTAPTFDYLCELFCSMERTTDNHLNKERLSEDNCLVHLLPLLFYLYEDKDKDTRAILYSLFHPKRSLVVTT
jgi:TFIIF-interacting CTD phosphatase-like protein